VGAVLPLDQFVLRAGKGVHAAGKKRSAKACFCDFKNRINKLMHSSLVDRFRLEIPRRQRGVRTTQSAAAGVSAFRERVSSAKAEHSKYILAVA